MGIFKNKALSYQNLLPLPGKCVVQQYFRLKNPLIVPKNVWYGKKE